LGPDDFKTFAAIELHLRSNTLSAGELAKSAWSFQKAIFAQTTHLHEHELFQFPRKDKWRTKESIGLSLAMTESYRRANLLMEIYSIFRGSPIQTRRAGGVLFFDSMQPRFLSTAFEFFIDEGQGAGYKDMLKMGWVGLRGPQTYDVPGYFGFEFRSLRDVNDQMNQGAILDAIQKFMLSEQYRELNPELMNWANDSGIDLSRYQGDAALEKFWYRQGFKKLSQTLPSYLQVYFRNKLNRYIQISALQYLAGEDHAYEMLLYDWTQDPLFHGDQEGQKRLIRSQISALNAIYEGDKQPHDVLIQFLKVSGIASRTASTFGLDFKDITHPSAKAQH
jgi:environmental stress-induced protein Ves